MNEERDTGQLTAQRSHRSVVTEQPAGCVGVLHVKTSAALSVKTFLGGEGVGSVAVARVRQVACVSSSLGKLPSSGSTPSSRPLGSKLLPPLRLPFSASGEPGRG